MDNIDPITIITCRFGEDHTNRLFLYLGKAEEDSSQISMFDASQIGDEDRAKLISNKQTLRSMEYVERMAWIKENTPGPYASAFRRFEQSKIKIVRKLDPKLRS